MQEKLSFIPCEALLLRFDEETVVRTSGAKEFIDWDEGLILGEDE